MTNCHHQLTFDNYANSKFLDHWTGVYEFKLFVVCDYIKSDRSKFNYNIVGYKIHIVCILHYLQCNMQVL